MLVKIFIVIVMIAILLSLGSGLFYFIRDKGKTERTVKALSWRIGLSLTLFILLILGFVTGVIQPHDIGR